MRGEGELVRSYVYLMLLLFSTYGILAIKSVGINLPYGSKSEHHPDENSSNIYLSGLQANRQSEKLNVKHNYISYNRLHNVSIDNKIKNKYLITLEPKFVRLKSDIPHSLKYKGDFLLSNRYNDKSKFIKNKYLMEGSEHHLNENNSEYSGRVSRDQLSEVSRRVRSIRNRRFLFPSSNERDNDVIPSNAPTPFLTTRVSARSERKSDAEPKIDDIIRGIVKLLGGNVNLSGNKNQHTKLTTFGNPPRHPTVSSRINNRGPPKLHDLPYGFRPDISGITRPPVRSPIVPPPVGSVPDGRPAFVANTRPPILVPLPPSLNGRPRPNKPFLTGVPLPINVLPDGAHGDREDVTPDPAIIHTGQYATKSTPTVITEGSPENDNLSLVPSSNNVADSHKVTSSTLLLPTASSESSTTKSHGDDTQNEESSSDGNKPSRDPTTVTSTALSESVSTSHISKSSTLTTLVSSTTSKPSRLMPPSDIYSRHSIRTTAVPGSMKSPSRIHPLPPPPPPPAESTSFVFSGMPTLLPDPIRPFMTTGHPGLVLEDSVYTPGHVITAPPVNNRPEIFDVTVTALQGYGGPVAPTKVFPGVAPLITSASIPAEGSVYIDGRKTYFDLMPVTASKGAQTVGVGTVIPEKIEGAPFFAGVLNPMRPLPPVRTTRPQYRPPVMSKPGLINRPPPRSTKKPLRGPSTLGPPKRIDTCIVGYDTTCKKELGEVCRTEGDVSSCFCKPGTARRRTRTKCKKSVVLHLSLKVDKIGDRRIVWGGNYANPEARDYLTLLYEAKKALDSAMDQSRAMSNLYLGSSVNKFYSLGGKVIVNSTMKLLHTPQTSSTNIRRSLQRQLIRVIQANNNYIGNSVLVVDGPLNPIPDVSDVNECFDSDLNDCHEHAMCTNTFGGFTCDCHSGYTDRISEDPDKSGRLCESCSGDFCSKRGQCNIQNGEKVCTCDESYYGTRCEIDGEVIAVAVGASVAAVVIIVLTLIFLCMWSRRWKAQDRKSEIISRRPWGLFGWRGRGVADGRFSINLQQKGSSPYCATMEDRIRWAQIAETMAQQNVYAQQPEQLRPAQFYQEQRKPVPPPSEYASVGTLHSTYQQHFGMQHLSPPFFGPPFPTSKAPSTYNQYGPTSLNTASVGGVSRAPTLGARTPLPLRDSYGGTTLGPLGGGTVIHNVKDGCMTIAGDSSEEELDRPYHLPRPKSRGSVAVGAQSQQQSRLARSYNSLLF